MPNCSTPVAPEELVRRGFSDDARDAVMRTSHDLAAGLAPGLTYVIAMLALLRGRRKAAYAILDECLRVDVQECCRSLAETVERHPKMTIAAPFGLLHELIDECSREVRRLDLDAVTSDVLLQTLVRTHDPILQGILRAFDISYEKIDQAAKDLSLRLPRNIRNTDPLA